MSRFFRAAVTAALLGMVAPSCATATGGLDPSFGSSGVARVDFGTGAEARGVAADPSGRVLVTGVGKGGRLGVAVLLANGRPDRAFGRGGRVTIPAARSFDRSAGLAIIPAGDRGVLAAGALSRDGDGFIVTRAMVVRLTARGSPDRSFGGGDGTVVLGPAALRGGPSTSDAAQGITAQAGGKILVAGTTARQLRSDTDLGAPRDQAFLFARLSRDGSLDRSFGRGGRVIVRFPGAPLASVSSVAVDTRGRIVAVGRAGPRARRGKAASAPYLAVARLLPSGRLDATFDGDGRVLSRLALPFGGPQPGGLALQPDSKPVLSLTTGTDSAPFWIVRRLTAAGRPDPTFGTGGQAPVTIPGAANAGAGAMAIAGTPSCAHIVALGSATRPVAAALTSSGSLDPGFGTGGVLTLPVTVPTIGGAIATKNRVTFIYLRSLGLPRVGFDLARLVVPWQSCGGTTK